MRWLLCIAGAVAMPNAAWGQASEVAPATSPSGELTAGVAKAVDIIKAKPFITTLFYIELDDARPRGQSVVRYDAVARLPNVEPLLSLPPQEESELAEAVLPDMNAMGWHRLAIIVDNGSVTVAPGERVGPMEGFPPRIRALVDRVFRGQP